MHELMFILFNYSTNLKELRIKVFRVNTSFSKIGVFIDEFSIN